MEKQNLSIPIAIIIAGLIIGTALYFNNKEGSNKNDTNPPPDGNENGDTEEARPVDENDHILGNPDAPITIVEYSDTECPFCKRFHITMHQVMDEYGKDGRVRWVYRHFPIDQLHSKARKEAEATECAAELGGNDKFWGYIDRLYEITSSNNGLDSSELPNIAEYVGLDRKKFEDCLNSGKYAQKVSDDFQDGIKAGVTGTPHSVIIDENGQKAPIRGALPFTDLKTMIDSLLGE